MVTYQQTKEFSLVEQCKFLQSETKFTRTPILDCIIEFDIKLIKLQPFKIKY